MSFFLQTFVTWNISVVKQLFLTFLSNVSKFIITFAINLSTYCSVHLLSPSIFSLLSCWIHHHSYKLMVLHHHFLHILFIFNVQPSIVPPKWVLVCLKFITSINLASEIFRTFLWRQNMESCFLCRGELCSPQFPTTIWLIL